MKDNANDPTRNPFVVPGQGNPEPKTRRTPPAQPTTSDEPNPFRWVVPDKPTSTGQERNLDNESNPTTQESSPDPQSHEHGDPQSHVIPRRTDNDDNLNPTPGDSMLVPSATNPKTEGDTGPRASKDSIPTSGSVRLLEDHDDEDDDLVGNINGHSEDEQPSPDEDSFIWTGPVDGTEGARDDGGVRVDDKGPSHNGVSTGSHGGDGDRLLARHNVTVSDDGGSYAMDSTRLREGVQIGTVKRELRDYNPKPRRAPRKKTRLPFSPQIPKILDFLSRWRIGTTVQLARVAGWRDSNENRVLKKLRSYDEVGFIRETDLYAGPKIWTATTRGAEFGFHPWLGGVKASEINPMSQSHSFGLSSIASWLLCPWDTTPNILGLSPDEWSQVRGEIKAGTAWVLAEKEYRSAYSSIRTLGRGLLPAEYRHGFIGGPGVKSGAWREWARAYKSGAAKLDDSPELLACDPEFMGENMWMWIIWGNGVWNPKILEDRAAGEGIDLNNPEWSGRDGETRLRSEFRRYGYVPIEERLDITSNKPLLHKELGDRFALWDHLPDLIIARRRTDDGYADPQSIAIELELTAKPTDAYARTMASYGSPLGQTLYRKVIWLVPSKTIADRIRDGARQVGMVLGEDYDIVPFVTANKVPVIKRSFYSGDDILPGQWSQRGLIEPCEFRSIPLA